MKIVFRTVLYLALAVWLGAEVFFPMVAAITFTMLQPDTHAAGSIVGQLLRILHDLGLVSGTIALILLALAPSTILYKPRHVLAPMALVVLMIAGTVYSQFGIIPAMERDRMGAGGAIHTENPNDAFTTDFNRLHRRSEHVEGGILVLGLAALALIAKAETARA